MSRTETALGLEARTGPAGKLAKIALYAVLVTVFAGPLVALLVSSFTRVSDPSRFTIWPDQPTLRNYEVAIDRGALRFLLNSFLVVGGGLLLQVFVAVLAGYALARKKFRGATLVLLLILSTMMLPEEILAIPLSLVLGDLPVVHVSILNTLWGMIIPVGAWAVSIIVMTEFMKEIPFELEEAARIDGAGEFRVFWSVILPLCQPALGVTGILGFSMIWDQYILPLLVAQDSRQYTLSLALRTFRSDDQAGLGVLLAGAALALLPSVVVFLSFQRQFMRGLTSGAVKG
ncbi:MAG TPA: carbohydrate ABC transporter permease [Planosporangium sp.]|nr:carbohydrate ABC transporter permease [Planosporangium sp.]